MNNQNNAKYAFYYLLSFVALIFTSLSVGMILFQIIDKSVVDILNNYASVSNSTLKFAISALIIAAPVFYIISRLIYRDLKMGELDKDAPLRRWLTYFILLVSSIIILGVFIGVINNFLSGELTWRFILKALTILLIAAAVFSFYFLDLRRKDFSGHNLFLKIYFFISLVVVVAVFTAAWFYVESPATARAKRLDQMLVSNIYNVENAVNVYFEKNKKLPASLNDLELNPPIIVGQTNSEAIIYNKLSDSGFELCANFRTDSRQDLEPGYVAPVYPASSNFNYHTAGYQCNPGTLWSQNNQINKQPVLSQ
ncbi:MAG: DUF5671 domain-containing protein [Candidatus Falkowbacteria bacterium]|nr:DUF5671 domain-containing protein [Candidatus Falkowbacteria bacterium]